MAQQKIFGYANRISVRPGEEISFHVNCDGASEAEAQLVRLIHGDSNPVGPGHIEAEVDSPVNGRWAVKKQFTQLGSYLEVADPERKLEVAGSFSLMAFIWPTLPCHGTRQTILGRWDTLGNAGYALGINPAGHLEFWIGNGSEVDYVTAELPLLPKVWYFVGVSYDRETGRARIYQ
jgi:Concanavalin A-like lectin/glucanases superfamily